MFHVLVCAYRVALILVHLLLVMSSPGKSSLVLPEPTFQTRDTFPACISIAMKSTWVHGTYQQRGQRWDLQIWTLKPELRLCCSVFFLCVVPLPLCCCPCRRAGSLDLLSSGSDSKYWSYSTESRVCKIERSPCQPEPQPWSDQYITN